MLPWLGRTPPHDAPVADTHTHGHDSPQKSRSQILDLHCNVIIGSGYLACLGRRCGSQVGIDLPMRNKAKSVANPDQPVFLFFALSWRV